MAGELSKEDRDPTIVPRVRDMGGDLMWESLVGVVAVVMVNCIIIVAIIRREKKKNA